MNYEENLQTLVNITPKLNKSELSYPQASYSKINHRAPTKTRPMLKSGMRFLILVLVILLAGCEQLGITKPPTSTPPTEPPLNVQAVNLTVLPKIVTLARGQTHSHEIFLQVDDPENTLKEAVAFLYVAYITDTGPTNALAAGYFTRPDTVSDETLFGTVLSGDDLRKGINSLLSYKVSDTAPSGLYRINIQVFPGSNTNPSAIGSDDQKNRLIIHNTDFYIK